LNRDIEIVVSLIGLFVAIVMVIITFYNRTKERNERKQIEEQRENIAEIKDMMKDIMSGEIKKTMTSKSEEKGDDLNENDIDLKLPYQRPQHRGWIYLPLGILVFFLVFIFVIGSETK
jgi:uncharacterized membrane protein